MCFNRGLRLSAVIFVLSLPMVSGANLLQMGDDEKTIISYQPRTEITSSEEIAQQMAQKGTALLLRELNKLRQSGQVTDKMFNDKNEDNFIAKRNRIYETLESLIKGVNSEYKKRRDQIGGEISMNDLLPKSYMIFFATKLMGKNKGKEAAPKLRYLSLGSVSFGIIMTPVIAQTISVRTGEVLEEKRDALWNVIFWPHGDAANFEVQMASPGRTSRLGVGLIWDLKDKMVKPDDFTGLATSVSISNLTYIKTAVQKLAPGLSGLFGRIPKLIKGPNNYKLGVLYDMDSVTGGNSRGMKLSDMMPDYAFFTVAKVFGASGKIVETKGFKWNPVSAVMSIGAIGRYAMNIFNTFAKRSESELASDIADNLTQKDVGTKKKGRDLGDFLLKEKGL